MISETYVMVVKSNNREKSLTVSAPYGRLNNVNTYRDPNGTINRVKFLVKNVNENHEWNEYQRM